MEDDCDRQRTPVPKSPIPRLARPSEKPPDRTVLEDGIEDQQEEEAKPCIRLVPGASHLASAEAEKVLAATGRYYNSGGALVRLLTARERVVGTERVNEPTLRNVLAELIHWQRQTREGIWISCDPPYSVVQTLLHGQDRHQLPFLASIARQPFFGADGEIVYEPGYDPNTGIFGAFSSDEFQPIDESTDEPESYLADLHSLVEEVEFETENDRSAALCAMLTAAVRPALSVAPAFSFTAPVPGSGKSLLADIVSMFASPDEPKRVKYPHNEEEADKLIISLLMQKPAVIIFDDMQTNWKSLAPVNSALTSSVTTGRLMRTNNTATVETRSLFLGCGNGVEPEKDLRRRVITIRITPRHENPSLRKFRGDPLAKMKSDRAAGVNAALGIIEAYRRAGEPLKGKIPPVGSYGSWSSACREPLMWLGLPDPATSMFVQLAHDPDKEVLAHFLDVWKLRLGGRSVMVREIVAKAGEYPDLMEAIEDLPFSDGRFINRHKLGQYIAKNEGRWADDLRIEKGTSTERRSWRVAAR